MTKKTALYQAHLDCGGKMVTFAGFSLPIHYGSQLAEHHAVREDCGVFDVSHMCIIDISGVRTTAFMRHLIANDVAKLKPYQALYSCMLNKHGGVMDDLIAYKINKNAYRLVVNAKTAAKDIRHIQKIARDFSVAVKAQSDLAMLAIQGKNAIAKFSEAMPGTIDMIEKLAPFNALEVGRLFITRTGYTGEDGLEIMLPAKSGEFTWQMLIKCGVKPCGLGARDTLRLEAGMSLYGNEIDVHTSPLDAGLAWSVDLSDNTRHFIGRDKLATPRFNLFGLLLEGKGVMRSQQMVKTNIGEGIITSGGFSPTMARSIALARLPVGSSGMAEIELHKKRRLVRIVKPRFVRDGKIIV